ncbi:protein FIZZY-RELATED 3-like [Vitis vinifera]|uniref:protein FIZZY-RELATED 3-like n=1 Tax=Vitis vinifera TaxID=29760 RepID=UPI0008FEBA70|nr:protein FIZZY-RELATED 3-like [Vitis vinifera]|eukprot:XP_019078947.1 PREDICTED: protein FIZZY-RELATED 3-like [Vitis vinifera]
MSIYDTSSNLFLTNAAVKAIAWSPHQSSLLASGGGTADWYIRFWSTTSGNQLNHVDKGSQVCNLAWSRNVNELVSTHGYSQNQIMVWKHPSMTKVTTLTGHSLLVLYLAMSWDGQAEKWRRDRINSQLATLSKLIPKSEKVHLDRPEAKNAIGKEMLRGLQNTFVAIIIGVG